MQTSDAMRREIAISYSVVIRDGSANPHTRRTIQYSRESSDCNERPRRTGSSAFADDDGGVLRRCLLCLSYNGLDNDAKPAEMPYPGFGGFSFRKRSRSSCTE